MGNKDGDQDAFAIYYRCETKCRKLSKFSFYYGCLQLSSFFVGLIGGIFDILRGKIGTSAFNLPLSVALPVDTHSIHGWLLDWLFQLIVGAAYNLSMILTTAHFACFCYYIIAISNCFDLLTGSLRIHFKQIQNEKNIQKLPEMWHAAKAKLQLVIETHINIYE